MFTAALEDRTEKEAWLELYKRILLEGVEKHPRGLRTHEVQDALIEMNTMNRFPSFQERKLNLRYIFAEFLWYLHGDRGDLRIAKYAPFWSNVIDDPARPSIWSQYGFYAFRQGQLRRCIDQLIADPDTRKASIIIASPENSNLPVTAKDTCCTYAVNFSMAKERLEMRVSMRSNDFIRGLQSDFFQFSVWQELVWSSLRRAFPDLQLGKYVHKADSLHVYKRHFRILDAIGRSDGESFKPVLDADRPPRIGSHEESDDIIDKGLSSGSPFVAWMKERTSWE